MVIISVMVLKVFSQSCIASKILFSAFLISTTSLSMVSAIWLNVVISSPISSLECTGTVSGNFPFLNIKTDFWSLITGLITRRLISILQAIIIRSVLINVAIILVITVPLSSFCIAEDDRINLTYPIDMAGEV